ncbi:MAG: hypothetical protein O6909_05230 [Alphaproteobacteria bacterium]|nr:hypothetical protein [Alphaproteobacteria bacterium]
MADPLEGRSGVREELIALFNDGRDNIEFLKLQQWRIANYALLLIGGLFAISKLTSTPLVSTEKHVLILAAVVVAFLGCFYLTRFQRTLVGHRRRLGFIRENYFSDEFKKAWAKHTGIKTDNDTGFFEIVVPLYFFIGAAVLAFAWFLFRSSTA